MDEKEPGLEKARDKSAPLAGPARAKALRPLVPDQKPVPGVAGGWGCRDR